MAVLAAGDVLGDRYRLDEFVAAGGMGQVWRATDTVLGRTVAVKVLLPALLTDPGFEARFRAEARIIAGLRHAGVVNVYDYGESKQADGGRTLYLVMAFVEGESLSQRIAAAGRLSVAETMPLIAQAADALNAAHASGIVHRDVKPGNLLVQPDGSVTLVDFGVARSSAVTSVTTGNAVPGTALYMAPEQASGKPVAATTDVYALGAVAYHCLAGHPPFSGDNAIEIALKHLQDEPPPLPDDVPAPARALVERAMAKNPADRYPSAAALARAARGVIGAGGAQPTAPLVGMAAVRPTTVRPAIEGEPKTAHDLTPLPLVGPDEPDRPTNGRRRRAAIIGAAAATVVVAGAFIALLGFSPDGKTPATTDTPTSAAASLTPSPTRTGTRPTNTPRPTTATTSATASAEPSGDTSPSGATTRTTQPTPTSEPSVIVSVPTVLPSQAADRG
jgi:serine/threonine-protein kinase